MNSQEIKGISLKLGADLVGIASIERFKSAPEGFHPRDIFPDCQAVIAFAKALPAGLLQTTNCVPYTLFNQIVIDDLDHIGLSLALALEKETGVICIPIPSDDPYISWDPDRMHGRGILSMRHAGYFAGLGVIGKSGLLINEHYGNMMELGAVLINAPLEQDPLATYEGCISSCTKCMKECPAHALDGVTVNQKLCRIASNVQTRKGYVLKRCYTCRKVCPNANGIKRKRPHQT